LFRRGTKNRRRLCGAGVVIKKEPVPVLNQTQGQEKSSCGATLFALHDAKPLDGEQPLPCPVTGAAGPGYCARRAVHPALGGPFAGSAFRPFPPAGLSVDALRRFISASSV